VTNFSSLPGASAGSATFGAPIFLDLGGRGIRSIERNNTGQYLIIAGPTGGAGTFKFYTWTGLASDQPIERLTDLSTLNANGSFESIVNLPDNLDENSVIQLLVDNGDAIWYNDGIISKDLGDVNFQKFRSESIALGDPVTFSISGIIEWSRNNNNGVKDATVNLSVGATDSELSDVDGTFTFDGLVTPGNFTIKPVKNLNKLNGVTVGDALRIQQHITGLNLITDPYDLVAADVNGSNTVTILDATLINQSLNNNQNALNLFSKSWRFVPQSHTMSNPPWGFPEQIDLTNISDDQTGLDFYGIKIGDVVTAFANPSQFAGAAPLVFRIQDQMLNAGETIAVSVRADQLADLAAWQFALRFDPEVLSFVSVNAGETLPVSTADFNVEHADAGDIRSVWMAEESNAIAETEVVFHLTFTVQKSGMLLSEVLFLMEEELPALGYSAAMQEMNIRLEYSVSTDTKLLQHTANQGVQLMQNRPNPFVDVTQIDFSLPQAGPVSLRVFDLAGRLVQEMHGEYPAGAHSALLDMSGTSAFGVLHYELQTPFGVMTKKMVR